MMIEVYSFRDRVLAYGILLLGLLAFWMLVLRPLYEYPKTLETAVLQAHREEEKFLTSIQKMNEALELASVINLSDELWSATQTGELNARLQARLSELTKLHSVNLRQVTPLTTKKKNASQNATLQLEVEGDLHQINALIYAIDQNKPAFFIDTLTLRRLPRANTLSEQPIVLFQAEISAPANIVANK